MCLFYFLKKKKVVASELFLMLSFEYVINGSETLLTSSEVSVCGEDRKQLGMYVKHKSWI